MGRTLLVVDDLPEGIRLVVNLLKEHFPYTTFTSASQGEEALNCVATHPPDLVILDAMMPVMDGFEVCRKLKSDPLTRGIPILMLSGALVKVQDRIRGLKSGADGYLCKPFEKEELIAQVNALLRLKDIQDELRDKDKVLEELFANQTTNLKESERRFHSLFENSPDAIFVESPEGNVLEVNAAACALHGMTRGELVGKNIMDLVPPSEREQVRKHFSSWFQGTSRVIEANSYTKGGYAVPVEIRGSRIQFEKKAAVLLQVRNISERRKVDNALRDLAQGVSADTGLSFFYSLAQNLANALDMDFACIVEVDPENIHSLKTIAAWHAGTFVDDLELDANDALCQHLVQAGSINIPSGISTLFPESQLALRFGADHCAGCTLTDTDDITSGLMLVFGEQRTGSPELAESLLQVFAARAAAELGRKRAAEALWESQERYRSLSEDVLETSPMGMMIVDEQENVVWANQTVAAFFDTPREALLMRPYQEVLENIIHPNLTNPPSYSSPPTDPGEPNEPTTRREYRLLASKNREERWLEYLGQAIETGLYTGGRIEYFIDITPIKQLEQQLLQAQKMESIGRLAGGIAHDFNNLLTSILGFGRMLREQLDDKPGCQEDVAEIMHAGERAAKLTRQLLAFGRQQMIQIRPVGINTVVSDMAQLLLRTVGEDVEVNTLLEADLGPVEADDGQLEQVLLNLAINARDAMPQGGKLTIQTATRHLSKEDCRNLPETRPGTFVMLSVTDTGCGMSPQVLQHAFEPFFTTKDIGKGTGLGLSTVYGIVKQFEGSIELESQVGQGSTVRMYFPMAAQRIQMEPPETHSALPGGDETILLVEDEDTVRHLTMRMLRNQGYNVLQARNGNDALNHLKADATQVDLLLTDVVMPKMSGPQLANEVNRERPTVKVLFTSGFAEETMQQHGMDQAEIALLTKPYDYESLTRKVREILDTP